MCYHCWIKRKDRCDIWKSPVNVCLLLECSASFCLVYVESTPEQKQLLFDCEPSCFSRSKALLLLKKKRYQDQLLDKTENQISNLERMVSRRGGRMASGGGGGGGSADGRIMAVSFLLIAGPGPGVRSDRDESPRRLESGK